MAAFGSRSPSPARGVVDVNEIPFFAGVFGPNVHGEVDVRFNDVDWKGLLRKEGSVIQRDDVDMLKNSESQPLDYLLGSDADGRRYVTILQRLLLMTATDRTTQCYALSRIKGVLTQSPQNYSKYFVPQGANVVDPTALMRSIRGADPLLSEVASISLALLYVHTTGGTDSEPLVTWINEQLKEGKASSRNVIAAISALMVLLRGEPARHVFVKAGGMPLINTLLRMQGGDGATAQIRYSLCLCLWSLSLSEDGAFNEQFQSCMAVPTLVEQVAAAPSEKVVRVALATLCNLSKGPVNAFNTEMISCGLVRTLENLRSRKWVDTDIAGDVEELRTAMARNYRDLTTFEVYSQEVLSGRLRPGLVHTEKFWRECAKSTEADDFFIIRRLIDLLKSEDDQVVSLACYDLGEFVRFYPNGKAILRHLGAKTTIMDLIEHSNHEVRKHALICISKLMVNKWEFVR